MFIEMINHIIKKNICQKTDTFFKVAVFFLYLRNLLLIIYPLINSIAPFPFFIADLDPKLSSVFNA